MKQGPIVIAWILILYNKLMNSNAYDEQLSNQSFILLDDDLWKGIEEALGSDIMVNNVLFDVYIFGRITK